MPSRRRVLQTLTAGATLGAGAWALTTRRPRQRLLQRPGLRPFRRHPLLQSGRRRTQGPARLPALAAHGALGRLALDASRAPFRPIARRQAWRAMPSASPTSGMPRSSCRRTGSTS